jgi:hypothetical protein
MDYIITVVVLIIDTFVDAGKTQDTVNAIDDLLVYIYVAEVIIKIIGLGLIDYFSSGWNVYFYLI